MSGKSYHGESHDAQAEKADLQGLFLRRSCHMYWCYFLSERPVDGINQYQLLVIIRRLYQ